MSWRAIGRKVALVGVLPAVLLTFGCNNIWEWTVDDQSFDALMADGHEALANGLYGRAEAKFSQAVDQRPGHAGARYYLAKSAVLNGNVDVFELVQTLTDDTGGAGATEIFEYEAPTANSIYRVNRVVLDALEPIRAGVATEGALASADVDLDLAVAYTLRGVLRLRDTNGDGIIDARDVSIDDLGIGQDENGEWTIHGVPNVPPEDLNDMIEDLEELLDSGGDLVGDLGDDDSGIDLNELEDLLDQLGTDAAAFYVNTGVPGNPGEGDNDGDGVADEECLNGLDDDGDSLVDEDSRVLGCPPIDFGS